MDTAKGVSALTVFGITLVLAKVFELPAGGLALACLIGAASAAAALQSAGEADRSRVLKVGGLWGTVGVVFFLAYWRLYHDSNEFYPTLLAGYLVAPSLILAVYYLRGGSQSS